MIEGTYSTPEYRDVVHSVKPLHQGTLMPSQSTIDDYWAKADVKSVEPYDSQNRSCGTANPNLRVPDDARNCGPKPNRSLNTYTNLQPHLRQQVGDPL